PRGPPPRDPPDAVCPPLPGLVPPAPAFPAAPPLDLPPLEAPPLDLPPLEAPPLEALVPPVAWAPPADGAAPVEAPDAPPELSPPVPPSGDGALLSVEQAASPRTETAQMKCTLAMEPRSLYLPFTDRQLPLHRYQRQ